MRVEFEHILLLTIYCTYVRVTAVKYVRKYKYVLYFRREKCRQNAGVSPYFFCFAFERPQKVTI